MRRLRFARRQYRPAARRGSERNVVVVPRTGPRVHVLVGRNRRADFVGAALAAAAQHLDVHRDDLGAVALLALLVLPLPRADAPLDEDLPALGEVLAADLGLLAPHHDPMPLGLFLLLAA